MAYEDKLRSLYLKSGKLGGVKSKLVAALPGTVAEFGFPFTVETATTQVAALCKTYDVTTGDIVNTAVSNATGGAKWTADFQMFPDSEAIGDRCYFGAAAKFGVLRINVSATAATYGADAIVWKYWDGDAWSALTIIWDDTNTTPAAGGERPFMQDGNIIFSAPSDWALKTLDSQSGYWICAHVDAVQITQIPILTDEHAIITAPTGISVPYDCEIIDGKFSFITVSGANDHTDVILCNLTDGTCSAIKVITKQLNQGVLITFGSQVVSADDDLAFYVTDEDGTTEYADGTVEFTVLRK